MGCRVKKLPQDVLTSQITGLTVKGLITIVTINDTTWTALPALPLTLPADRNAIGVQNTTPNAIKLNFDSAVVGYVGWIVAGNSSEFFTDITPDVILYAKSAPGDGSVDITVMEIA